MAASIEHQQLPLPRIEGARLLVVVAPYYRSIAEAMVVGARAVAAEAGASVDLVEVPGALEIPTAIGMARRLANYDAYVALGCVIRGETTHYETVSGESARGLMDLAMDEAIAIGNGILTVENDDQAWARARVDGKNKGGAAAEAALRMIALRERFKL